MAKNNEQSIGEIISKLFDQYLEHYQDEDLAKVAAAATINDLLNDLAEPLMAEDETTQAA